NVVHATADLQRTVGNIRTLLAPGGIFLLLEMTTPLRWIDISFGMTDGWWKFSDKQLRPEYVLLEREQWRTFLHASGFADVASIPDAGSASMHSELAHQTVFIAQKPLAASGASGVVPSALIFADAGGTGRQ